MSDVNSTGPERVPPTGSPVHYLPSGPSASPTGPRIGTGVARLVRPLAVLVGVALVAGSAAWWAQSREQGPVRVRFLGVTGSGSTRTVSLEYRWPGRFVVYPVGWKYQYRVSGAWRQLSASPKFDATAFGARTNLQVVSFVVPAETEACRHLLNYRVGSRHYCRGYGLLARWGLLQRFPKASVAMLRWTLQQGATYDLAPVLELPAAAHGTPESVAPTGG